MKNDHQKLIECKDELLQAHQRISVLEKLLDEQREIEKILRKDEERYRSLTENTSDWIWEIESSLRFTYASPKIFDILGFKPEEVLGKKPTDFMTDKDKTRVEPFIEKLMNERPGFQGYESECYHRDGSVRFLETSAVPIYNPRGVFCGYRGISRDITGRKLEKQSFKRREERYRNFVENVKDCCFEFDLNGKCTFCNESVSRILGYSREEFTNLRFRQRYARREESDRIIAIIKKIHDDKIPSYQYEAEMLCKDGSVVIMEMLASPIYNDQATVVGFRSVGRDITARKKEQTELERYRDFLENITESCFETDLKGVTTYANKAAISRMGLTRDELIGSPYQRHAPPEEAKRIFTIFNEIYRTGEPGTVRDYEIKNPDRTVRFVDMVVSLMRNAHGKPIGFRVISRDVTERKKEMEELARYRDFTENVADGCFETDLAGNFTYINEIGASRLGVTRKEAIGINNRQYCRPEEVARIGKIFKEVYQTGKPAIIDHYETFNQKGQVFFLEMSVSLIRDAKGNPVGFRGTTRDTTERKRILDALTESEENYRLLIDNSPIGILVYSPEGKVIMGNKQARLSLETSEYQMAGRLAGKNRWTVISPEGNPLAPDEHPINKAIRQNAPVNDMTCGVVLPESGKVSWFIVNVYPQWDQSGRMLRVIESFIDITLRRNAVMALAQNEAKYRFLTEKISDVVWTTDLDMRLTYLSPSSMTALGYSPEEMLEKTPDQFMTDESRENLMKALRKNVNPDHTLSEAPEKFISYETANYHKNGDIVWFDNVASSIRDDSGKLIGYHGVSRNITGQKKAAMEKEKLIEELKKALVDVKTLTGMLPICSHCKKIRDDQGYWNQLEGYITEHSDALFSHCICPDCAEKLYAKYLPKENP